MWKSQAFLFAFLLILGSVAAHSLEVVFVRHGETVWNDLGYFQGASDIPLNETGRQQARAARLKFQEMPFDAVYSSALVRAAETADILCAQRDERPQTDARWNEISFGEFEGQRPQDVDRSEIDLCLALPAGQGRCGVEPLESFDRRVRAALHELLERHQHDARVLVVCHGGIQRWLIEKLLSNDAELTTRYGNLEYFAAQLDDAGRLHTTGRG